ncbi:MAG: membrane protein insertion efficiency factor YidD [Bacteriovoracia bacterium]
MNRFFQLLIRGYQLVLSPFLGGQCRFHPSCSHYGYECFERFSLPKALWYTVRRISRCHPWHAGGVDPVPDK